MLSVRWLWLGTSILPAEQHHTARRDAVGNEARDLGTVDLDGKGAAAGRVDLGMEWACEARRQCRCHAHQAQTTGPHAAHAARIPISSVYGTNLVKFLHE